jgi:opacity protein-like surface antigen
MRTVHVGWVVLCLMVLAPVKAAGQYGAPPLETGVTGRVVWNIGGTFLIPVAETADRVEMGGGFTVGLTFNPSAVFGVQFEYGANWADLDTGKLQGANVFGNTMLHYFNLNGMIRPARAGPISFYLIGGGGLYYRYVDIARVEGTALVPYCDPWLLICTTVPVTASTLIGSRDSWDWGLDGGVGVTFALAPPVRLYLEARYHYIFGPSFTAADGRKRSADGQYVPITLGIRF